MTPPLLIPLEALAEARGKVTGSSAERSVKSAGAAVILLFWLVILIFIVYLIQFLSQSV